MLLKKMCLTNFRPFKGNHEMNFSTDINKNITLVMAENGAGKTTLSQAFQWILYGDTEGFKNKSLLNSIVEKEMYKNSKDEVIGLLEMENNNIEYTIIRKQIYKKDMNNIVKPDNSILEIYIKDEKGQIVINNPYKNISTIANILPRSLSKYFFFDGERIEKMAGEVSSGKSEEFKTAVQNILGLTALTKAIEHLGINKKDSVIGKYIKQMDDNGDGEITELRDKIYSLRESIELNNKKVEKIEEQIGYYEKEIEKAKAEIISFRDVEELQKQLNNLNQNLKFEIQNKKQTITLLTSNFSKQAYSYFSRYLVKEVLQELQKTENIDKGIPSMRAETIKFLMERKKCVCGNDLSDSTSESVQNLIELLKYIPPQSLGTSIKNFQVNSDSRIKHSNNYFLNAESQFSSIRAISNKIENIENEIGNIDQTILNSSNDKVTDLKNREKSMTSTLKGLREEKSKIVSDNLFFAEKQREAELEISRMEVKIEKNKSVEEQLLYAQEAYNKIKARYDFEEAKTREKLEDTINELFKQIYAGGMTINIDEKYKIASYVDELDDSNFNIDSNTAKSYSIIFAFIVGVIKLAKQKVLDKSEEIITDEFPLVMDAPLSSFDQKRIKNICNVIPDIARQVIIFIKDTDGNIAKKEMNSKIGIEYNVYLKNKEVPLDSGITKVGEI